MYTPVSFEQPTHPELIPPIDPHQREAADARFALVRAHQYSISLAASGFERDTPKTAVPRKLCFQ